MHFLPTSLAFPFQPPFLAPSSLQSSKYQSVLVFNSLSSILQGHSLLDRASHSFGVTYLSNVDSVLFGALDSRLLYLASYSIS